MAEGLGGKLHIRSPEEPDRVFPIEQAVVRIGRAQPPQNELTLHHGWVSRAHARIYCDRLPYRIQDMRSSNGTSVNDVPLPPDEIRPLKDGDIIAIGPFRLTFEAPSPPWRAEPSREGEEELRGLSVRAAPKLQPPVPPGGPPGREEEVQPRPPERWVGMPDRASRWLQYLPPLYSEDEFLGRFLLILEDLLGPVQQLIAHFDLFLDPTTAPDSFLSHLDNWLAGIVDERWPAKTQRELLKNASWLYHARGTKAGLRRHLEICTGCQSEIIENADGPHTFRVIVHSKDAPMDRRAVERIIEMNRPAHTAYTLELAH